MLFRSTGLGKTEMAADIETVERQGDYLILRVRTTDPVVWKVRVALSFKDVAKVLKALVRVSVIGFMLSPSQWFKKKADHPGDF
jgi:hypothetical protein